MKKTKIMIGFTLLFMVIGIAAVTTNVIVNMSTPINQNPDDFLVYFSDVEVDGTQDLSLVENEQKLVFNGEFTAIGDKKVISYDVTNASKNYDAEILIDCTESTTYLNITNVFDMKNVLSARSSRTGTLTIELANAVSNETTQNVTCTITANAVERESQGSGDVGKPLERYPVGSKITIGDELFNVISSDATTVTMLAQHNIRDTAPYKQTSSQMWTTFSSSKGWEYTTGPREIDVNVWGGDSLLLLNNYVSFLYDEYGIWVTADLITLSQLRDLGCYTPTDYAYGQVGGWNCYSSSYGSWLLNSQSWWTRSINLGFSNSIWIMLDDGLLSVYGFDSSSGVRPVITISKSDLKSLGF